MTEVIYNLTRQQLYDERLKNFVAGVQAGKDNERGDIIEAITNHCDTYHFDDCTCQHLIHSLKSETDTTKRTPETLPNAQKETE